MISEKEYLENYNQKKYDKPSIAVDLLVFTIEDNRLKIVLVERKDHPFMNMLSVPGTFVRMDESLEEAAKRGAFENVGLSDIYFEQLFTWGDVDRDPRMRIISVSYLAFEQIDKMKLTQGRNTISVALYDVDEMLEGDTELAFDHRKIMEYARERIKNKVEYSKIAFEFLPEEFTLPELQRIYEILLNKKLYKAGFRRKIADMVEETDKMTEGDAHRPSKYYRLKLD